MTVQALLEELRARDIWVWADGNRLQCSTPAGVPQSDVSDLLRQRKTEILEFLRGPAALSFSQQRLWFLDQIAPRGPAYVMIGSLELRGALNAPVLERALRTLVDRHEALRTVFVNLEGEPRQVVSEPGAWTLPVVDLSAEADKDQRLRELLREEATRGFDLARGPLFRARLYRLAADSHVLLLAMHHIISDGWSIGILIRELGELYARLARGEAATLPALKLQYRDFARWQRGWLQGEALEVQLAHWRARLAGAPQVLELPADRPRPSVESFRGAFHSFTLPLELADALRGLARREGATLFMTLLAGFTLLLSRYSGQQDLLVGTPVANRSRTEIEDVVGCFVNTLVLRADLSGELSVRQYLARMREVCLDAYAHQDLPFERLVEELQPQRDMSRNPVFQVMFALQNAPMQPLELPGLTLSPHGVDAGGAQLDLMLNMQETADGISGWFNYATDLFDESSIVRMFRHLQMLFEGMVAHPQVMLKDLPLLTEAERQQVVVEWNDTAALYPAESLVHEMFEAQAQRTPERTVLRVGAMALSYAELNTRATRLAETLRSRGVSRGQRVGLCVERGADMLAAVLGILKAGAAYVPLDPSFPAERLRFMAEDAQLALLVSTTGLAGAVGLPRERQLLLDADAKAIASAPDSPLPVDAHTAQPADPAYVIYTSGSTGKPKGVVVPHRAVVNFLTSMTREPGLTANDVLVAVTTLSFDIAVLELQAPLTVGATVVIASRDEAIDGRALRVLLEKSRATVMQATPATWRLLLEAGWSGGAPFKALVGGEALPKDLADQLIARGVELWNLYGPTETTVWSTCARIIDTSNGITIGKPIANTTVYILDAQSNLCPIGVPGELCIGGVGVTLGYWRRPELTADRFIPDPFSATPGATLYRTGDRARWRNDATLEHLGRLDFQVKLRGFRIELGEIEAVLAEHPEVRQAAVHLWQVKANDVRIVACCVPAKAGVFAPISLRKHMRARLPEYMVPQHFLLVEATPLTPNGKVDRSKLPTPAVTEGHFQQHEAPSDPVEATIAEIWTKLIHPARPIGRADKFFEMGGHSLLALRALRQMEHQLGVKLDFRALLQESPAEIATRCRQERIPEGGGDSGAARPVALRAETEPRDRVL
jgi:amino acid adenylation domain-containing protein